MDWPTIIISILGSGVVAAIVSAVANHITQIRAIKESGLYAKRAEILDEVMSRMERLDRVMGELISPIQFDGSIEAEQNRRKTAGENFNDLMSYYLEHRHYLPEKISTQLGGICQEYKKLFTDFSYNARPEDDRPNTKLWSELSEKYKKDFPDKRDAIAKEFRRIIGVK